MDQNRHCSFPRPQLSGNGLSWSKLGRRSFLGWWLSWIGQGPLIFVLAWRQTSWIITIIEGVLRRGIQRVCGRFHVRPSHVQKLLGHTEKIRSRLDLFGEQCPLDLLTEWLTDWVRVWVSDEATKSFVENLSVHACLVLLLRELRVHSPRSFPSLRTWSHDRGLTGEKRRALTRHPLLCSEFEGETADQLEH